MIEEEVTLMKRMHTNTKRQYKIHVQMIKNHCVFATFAGSCREKSPLIKEIGFRTQFLIDLFEDTSESNRKQNQSRCK